MPLMAYSVPTTNSAKSAAKTGTLEGAVLGAGESVGRTMLGPGVGTAVGGLAVAASQSGDSRDAMARIAFERAVNEVFQNSVGGGGGSQQRM